MNYKCSKNVFQTWIKKKMSFNNIFLIHNIQLKKNKDKLNNQIMRYTIYNKESNKIFKKKN